MTARDIQRRIIWDGYRRNFVLPNYTPIGWFECDVFELTKAGFFREYEIKISRSDFVADAKKLRQRWEDGWKPPEKKHDLLANQHLRGPSRFYFCTPEGLICRTMIPDWAGWITFSHQPNRSFPWSVHPYIERQAPVLHRCKALPELRSRALESVYWRFHTLLSERLKCAA